MCNRTLFFINVQFQLFDYELYLILNFAIRYWTLLFGFELYYSILNLVIRFLTLFFYIDFCYSILNIDILFRTLLFDFDLCYSILNFDIRFWAWLFYFEPVNCVKIILPCEFFPKLIFCFLSRTITWPFSFTKMTISLVNNYLIILVYNTQSNLLGILLNETEIGLYLPFFD